LDDLFLDLLWREWSWNRSSTTPNFNFHTMPLCNLH
jgi:hypothetical protein